MDTLINGMFMGHPGWVWLFPIIIVVTLITLDLGVLHKAQKEIGVRESLILSSSYVLIGLCFSIFVWFQMGADNAMDYLTGFIIEQSLSMDNIFVMALIFSAFHIPRKYQHRVLFWGIMGVIILRGIMIFAGAILVAKFHWVLYIFAGFLVLTGVKLLFMKDDDEVSHEEKLQNNPVIKYLRRHFNVTDTLHGQRFFVRLPHKKGGDKTALFITPLFLALVTIEIADIIFAVDSVPAIFAITQDPYIIYTSNIFAILGLRALYFALAAMLERFAYLKYALALILIFIGSKVFAADFLGLDKIPSAISLGVTVTLLAGGMFFSLWKTAKHK